MLFRSEGCAYGNGKKVIGQIKEDGSIEISSSIAVAENQIQGFVDENGNFIAISSQITDDGCAYGKGTKVLGEIVQDGGFLATGGYYREGTFVKGPKTYIDEKGNIIKIAEISPIEKGGVSGNGYIISGIKEASGFFINGESGSFVIYDETGNPIDIISANNIIKLLDSNGNIIEISGNSSSGYTIKDKNGNSIPLSEVNNKQFVLLDDNNKPVINCSIERAANVPDSHTFKVVGVIDEDCSYKPISAKEASGFSAKYNYTPGVKLAGLLDEDCNIQKVAEPAKILEDSGFSAKYA